MRSRAKHKTEACATLEELIARSDAVVVATTNDQLVGLSTAVVRAGKHVVVEKPAARTAKELEPLATLAREQGVVVKVGFNHRFHPAAQKARAILDAGDCGDIMFIRGRYGHGGRVGYDKEWRADPAKSGGGELIDQGVHLIDLARWFLGGELTDVQGRVETYFWKMPVDDNAFLTLGTAARQVAHLQVSCTEWKNMFSLEIYARHAKLHWEGLGGSYGPERLYHYAMRPEMGPARRGHPRVRAVRQVVGARVGGLRPRRPREDAPLRRRRGRPAGAAHRGPNLRSLSRPGTGSARSRSSAIQCRVCVNGFSARNFSVSTTLSSIVLVGAHPRPWMRFVSSRIFGESPGQPRSPPAYSMRGDRPIVLVMTPMLSFTSIQSVWPRLNTLMGSRASSTATSIAATQSPTCR